MLDRGGWSTSRPGRFTSRKDPVPTAQEAGWASGPVWTRAENLTPHWDSIPGPSSRRNSLYRLSYRGPPKEIWAYFKKIWEDEKIFVKVWGKKLLHFLSGLPISRLVDFDKNLFCMLKRQGDRGGKVVKVLCYKSEGSLVRSQMVSLEFFIDIILPAPLWAWGSTQPLTEMSTRRISWG